jgi:hypothetical protein
MLLFFLLCRCLLHKRVAVTAGWVSFGLVVEKCGVECHPGLEHERDVKQVFVQLCKIDRAGGAKCGKKLDPLPKFLPNKCVASVAKDATPPGTPSQRAAKPVALLTSEWGSRLGVDAELPTGTAGC